MLTSLTRYEDWRKIGGVCVVVDVSCWFSLLSLSSREQNNEKYFITEKWRNINRRKSVEEQI